MRRDRLVHVRLTHPVRKWIEDDARAKKMTMSQWLRWVIKKEIQSRKEPA